MVYNFRVGQLREYVFVWELLISDFFIFDVIKYYYIEFEFEVLY